MCKLNGNDILKDALIKLGINLSELVAMTSIWASPEYCNNLKQKKGSSTRYPNIRRGRAGEERGSFIKGVKIDDNTYANNAIKYAVGINRKDIKNFNACHIYENTCYDERYHTKIENLVLIPNAIAQLSDNFEEVINCLKYRAFELYGWYPEESEKPVKPHNYPTNWRKPEAYIVEQSVMLEQEKEAEFESEKDSYIAREINEIEKVKNRVPKWFSKDTQINSFILIRFLELLDSSRNNIVSREELKEVCSNYMNDFPGNFNQMANFGEHNHAKVFEIDRDSVWLWKPVAEFVLSEYQKYLISKSI